MSVCATSPWLNPLNKLNHKIWNLCHTIWSCKSSFSIWKWDKNRERNKWAKVVWESPCKCETRQHSPGTRRGGGMFAVCSKRVCVCVRGHIWKLFNLIIPCVLSMNYYFNLQLSWCKESQCVWFKATSVCWLVLTSCVNLVLSVKPLRRTHRRTHAHSSLTDFSVARLCPPAKIAIRRVAKLEGKTRKEIRKKVCFGIMWTLKSLLRICSLMCLIVAVRLLPENFQRAFMSLLWLL